MNFDTYIAEAVELNDEKKRVASHYRQNRSLEWAIKDRNHLQFEVINGNGFTNIYGGGRLRYWESDFDLPTDVDCYFAVGVFHGDDIRYDASGNEKKVVSEVVIRQYGKEKFAMAKEFASDMKKQQGAAFTNIFAGTKLKAVKGDDDKWTYVMPEAA